MNKAETYTKLYKRQFRLFDVYRYIATLEQSHIKGIRSYYASKLSLHVIYDNDSLNTYDNGTFFYSNESELKNAVKTINKLLGNCHKPGKKVNK